MICRSENIRCIRCIYGVSYILEALWRKALSIPYTEYTDFSDIHPFFLTYFFKNVGKKHNAFARVRVYLTPYIPYIPYMTYLKRFKINACRNIRILKHTVYFRGTPYMMGVN